MSESSWRCGGCGVWYAPTVTECRCQAGAQIPILPVWPVYPYPPFPVWPTYPYPAMPFPGPIYVGDSPNFMGGGVMNCGPGLGPHNAAAMQ